MKRFAAALAVVALASAPFAFACDKEKAEKAANTAPSEQGGAVREVSMTGYLTDSYCGAGNASAKGKSCAVECLKKGAKLQLLANEKLYTLDKADVAESNIGVEVKVTGMLDESNSTIKVSSIEPTARKS